MLLAGERLQVGREEISSMWRDVCFSAIGLLSSGRISYLQLKNYSL